jgi:hypothetical protein
MLGVAKGLAQAISRLDEEGFTSYSAHPCYRAVVTPKSRAALFISA